jgi:hypothetical protein
MRNKLVIPRIIRVRLESDSSKLPKNKFHTYAMFTSGTLLAISESLPFMTDIKANGIIDALKKIREEYSHL